MNQNGMTASREVSRRTVVKAGAWAVPVVAAAVALPMAAASVTLAPTGSLNLAYNAATGVVEISSITFGIIGTGTPGASQETGALTVLIEAPDDYTVTVADGQNLGNGWVATVYSQDGSVFVLLTYAAGLQLTSTGTATAPQPNTTVVFSGPAGMPPRRTFAYEDSWANYPSWGIASVWPK